MIRIRNRNAARPAIEEVCVFPLLLVLVITLDVESCRLVEGMEGLCEEERWLVILRALEVGNLVTNVGNGGAIEFMPSNSSIMQMELEELTGREFAKVFSPPFMFGFGVAVVQLDSNAALVKRLSRLIASSSLRSRWRALGTVSLGLGKGHLVVQDLVGIALTLKVTKAGEHEGWGRKGDFLQLCLSRPNSFARH